MREPKKPSRVSKLYRPLITIFVAMSTALLGIFAALQLTSSTRNNNQVVDGNRYTVGAGGTIVTAVKGVQPLQPGETPNYIFNLPVLDGSQRLIPQTGSSGDNINTDAINFIQRYNNGLRFYDLMIDDISDIYNNAGLAILGANTWTTTDIITPASAKAGNYNDRTKVFENYQNLNNFGVVDQTKPLRIVKPNAIYDVYSVGQQGVDDVKLNTDNFAYQVASIDLGVLKDKKSLVFDYSDLSQPGESETPALDEHQYKIVISNQNGEIQHFIDTQAAGQTPMTLADLVNAGIIFVRDASDKSPASPYTTTQTIETLDKVRFVYDNTNNSNKLKVLIEPTDENDDPDFDATVIPATDGAQKAPAILFGVDKTNSDRDALSALQFGLLDNTHSPKHTKKISAFGADIDADHPIEPSEDIYPVDPTPSDNNNEKIIESLPIHALYGEFDNSPNTGYNGVQVFMGEGTKIEQQVRYNNQGTDAFDGGNNNLVIEFSQDIVGLKPDSGRFTIKQDKVDESVAPTNQPIKVSSEILGTSPAKFAQVRIELPSGIMQFNPMPNTPNEEQPYRIKTVSERIFFESPIANPVPPTTPLSDKKQISLDSNPKVADKDLELIGDIYKNWSGKQPELLPTGEQNPAYIKPDTTFVGTGANLVPGVNGVATFGPEALNPYNNSDFVFQFLHIAEPFQMDEDGNILRDNNGEPLIGNGIQTLGTQNGAILVDSQNVKNLYKDILSNSGDPRGSRITKDNDVEDDTWRPIYYDANGIMHYVTDDSQIVTLPTTGQVITTMFVDYTNMLSRWAVEKLGLTEQQVRDLDEYKLVDPSGSIGFVKARIIDRSGADGIRLQSYANALARYWTDPQSLTAAEQDIITLLKNQYASLLPNNANIAFIEGKGAWDETANNNNGGWVISQTPEEHIRSQQIIYYVLQPYLVAAINSVINVEYSAFQSKQNIALGTHVHKYLQGGQGDSIGVPDDIIKNIASNKPGLENMNLVALGNYGEIKTENGLEELTTLLDFIKSADLQNKYLTPAEATSFDKFMEHNDFADDTLFTDPANQSPLEDFLQVLSKIIGNILEGDVDENGEPIPTLTDIVNNISIQAYDLNADPDAAMKDIQKSIRAAINKITSDKVYGTLAFMGTSTDVTYLQSLVMGKNVYEIFDEYLRVNDAELTDDEKKTIADFRDKSAYDVHELSRLAINLGYYNLPYFVRQLTEENRVEAMADEMLHSDLSQNINLVIDTDNQLIQFITDSDSMTKYAFMGIGIMTFTMGTAIFGLSFRKSIRFSSKKAAVVERLIFASIALIGALLAAISFIPGLM